MIKGIIFDVGGTMINYNELKREVFYSRMVDKFMEHFDSIGTRVRREKLINNYTRLVSEFNKSFKLLERSPYQFTYQVLYDTFGYEPEEEDVEACVSFFHYPISRPTLYEDTIPTLELLKKDYRLGVISNYPGDPKEILNDMKNFGLSHYFEKTIVSSELQFQKPSRYLYSQVLKAMNLKPWECVFVGNSIPEDIWGAVLSGISGLYIDKVENNDLHPGYTIKTLLEIPKAIKRIEEEWKNHRPNFGQSIELLRKYQIPEGIVRHSILVYLVADYMSASLMNSGVVIDRKLVNSAALLHDIGKSPRGLGCGNSHHGKIGGEIVIGEGFPQLKDPIIKHVVGKLRENNWESWEEKIVYYADKLVTDRVITVDERMDDLIVRYPSFIEHFVESRPLIKEMELDIYKAMEKKLGDLPREILHHRTLK